MAQGADEGMAAGPLRVPDWRPAFTRFSGPMTSALGRIQAALAVTESLAILPAQEDELRSDATVGTIHYSTLIEGNTLSVVEAERAARGELERRAKAEIELVNYVETLAWLDAQHAAGTITYTDAFLLEMHRRMTRDLGREGDERFAPHHEGAYRDGEVFITDDLDQIIFTGPPHDQVPGLMTSLWGYLDSRRTNPTDFPGAVLAGLAHHKITEVHPFADGNGRTARTFAIAVLMREGLLPERIFSFERHYAEDKDGYFAALRTVKSFQTNYTEWLEYFLGGLADEYERVAERVRVINRATNVAGRRTRLSETQEQIIARLSDYESTTRRLADELDKNERTMRGELAELVKLGIVERRSVGRQRIYRLSGPRRSRASGRPGPPKQWTDARLREQLTMLMDQLGHFPSLKEMEAADRHLARAVRSSGGLKSWRRRLSR